MLLYTHYTITADFNDVAWAAVRYFYGLVCFNKMVVWAAAVCCQGDRRFTVIVGFHVMFSHNRRAIVHKWRFCSCRLRNILEMWKVRSPCNVHKHSKHRRTPLYLLELAAWLGRGRRRGWFCSHCQTKLAFRVLSLRPQGGALRALDPEDQNTMKWKKRQKKKEERWNLKLDFIKNNLNMNHKTTIDSLTNLSHSAPPPPFSHLLLPTSHFPLPCPETFSFSTLLPLPSVPFQKEKTRAVRKAC